MEHTPLVRFCKHPRSIGALIAMNSALNAPPPRLVGCAPLGFLLVVPHVDPNNQVGCPPGTSYLAPYDAVGNNNSCCFLLSATLAPAYSMLAKICAQLYHHVSLGMWRSLRRSQDARTENGPNDGACCRGRPRRAHDHSAAGKVSTPARVSRPSTETRSGHDTAGAKAS